MFYSQFILAKKGPLGTIWIAAHLERKLRKNQVADTDIGVSVDSILCPDVPIALRLSSHLLLGVVRIYSRKVNYLFHDCSEALLKVKQAFRSTAVDLPPEESTAPYHSITLPETFDLDDFELPDSFLHSNFVDHHVSTREQITLQDAVQGTGYSTIQFGLDERFGDDNASQIGLNLDEEVFLDNHSPLLNASAQLGTKDNFDRQTSTQPATPFADTDIDDDQSAYPEQKKFGIQKNLPDRSLNLHNYNTHTPDLNEMVFHHEAIEEPSGFPDEMDISHGIVVDGASTDSFDHSEGPPASAFLAKTNAIIQETPLLDDLEKTLVSNAVGDIMPNNSHIGQHCSNLTDEMSLNGLPCAAAEIVRVDGQEDSCSVQKEVVYIESVDKTDNCMETVNQDTLVDCTMNPGGLLETHVEKLLDDKLSDEGTVPSSVSDANLISRDTSGIGLSASTDKSETHVSLPCEHVVVEDCSLANHLSVLSSNCAIRPCCTHKSGDAFMEDQVLEENNPQLCTKEMFVHEETRPSLENQERSSEVHQRSGPTMASLEIKEDYDKSVNLVADIISNNQQDALQCSASSEYPEPERMLLDPSRNHGLPSDLEQCTAERGFTMSDESVGRLQNLSGRKRRLSDCTPNLLDGSSVNLPAFPHVKRNDSYVPHDDDLLASILVGKGTSSLKVKPTPHVPLNFSSKRLRRGPKTVKRKVLLDDAMVLHADTIRQQLMNTEDIRRIRKKVPCTRSEIWMIQKCLLEDEIFSQSILIGLPPDLLTLHCKINDPNTTFYSEINRNTQVISNKGNPGNSEVDGEVRFVGLENSNSVMTDVNRCAFPDHSNAPISAEMQSEHGLCSLGHDCEGKLEDMQNNAEQHVFGGAQTCSLLSEEVQHGDGRDKGTINAAFDTCSDMCVSFANETNDRESPTLMDHDHFLPKMGLPDISVESPKNGSTSDPANGVWIGSDALNVSEAQINIIETHVTSTAVDLEDAMKENEGRESLVAAEGQNTSPSYHSQLIMGLEAIASTIGETSSIPESNLETAQDVENLQSYNAVARDSCDFGSAVIGNDTEFLNMDDDLDSEEEANYNLPDPEEAESHENSGWSARTRGVARYLKLLFDDEYGHGRKIVAMDRLLMGKTRKEASRMFFETLVLKTRDYIHIEQEDSFKNISIKPGSKLLKSNF